MAVTVVAVVVVVVAKVYADAVAAVAVDDASSMEVMHNWLILGLVVVVDIDIVVLAVVVFAVDVATPVDHWVMSMIYHLMEAVVGAAAAAAVVVVVVVLFAAASAAPVLPFDYSLKLSLLHYPLEFSQTSLLHWNYYQPPRMMRRWGW